jgi:beta-glucanase (GH16 family)
VGSVAGYLDPFTCFDSTWWLKGAHSLGRGYLDPNNVQVTEGQLRLIQPRRSYDGGEIWASSKTGFGRYEASMRASPAPGTISSLFLYGEKPAGAYSATAFYVFDEIDIELLQRDGQWYAVFATWLEGDSNGDPLWQHWEPLTYDPSAEFHTYAIEYARGSVTFSIDGQEIVTPPSDVVPTSDMYLMANAWWPTWLEGKRSRKTVYATYDWIAFTPAGATGLGGESNGRGRGSGL